MQENKMLDNEERYAFLARAHVAITLAELILEDIDRGLIIGEQAVLGANGRYIQTLENAVNMIAEAKWLEN
jgi:hypothetical protein